jgi:hypothetical protein
LHGLSAWADPLSISGMHGKLWFALAVAGWSVAVLLPLKSQAQSKPKTWEYKTLVRERYFDEKNMTSFSDWTTTIGEQNVTDPHVPLEGYLNQLGAQGWELVSAAPMEVQRSSVTNNRMYYVFKRAK